jgi:hypothetical protein
MKMRFARGLLGLAAVLCLPSSLQAQAPSLINYQGRLLNGTNLVNGSVGLSLRLFDASSGGTKLYEDSNSVTVVDGLYATLIGDGSNFGQLPSALENTNVWVEVAVNGTALSPRERLASVGYALMTYGLQAGTNGAVTLGPRLSSNTIHASASFATLAGGYQNSIGENAFASFLGGGELNAIGYFSFASVIGGGSQNAVADDSFAATVAGGSGNKIGSGAPTAAIGGGSVNTIARNGQSATIAGGGNNFIGSNSAFAAIGGGQANSVAGESTSAGIGGGWNNAIGTNSDYSAIGGGLENAISNQAPYAAIPGGRQNSVANGATNAFAAGRQARAQHQGAFVWGDNRASDIVSTNDNSVTFRSYGGFRIYTAAAAGAILPPGGGSWTSLSDVHAKENFRAVDGAALLDKVAALPIREWNYRTQEASIRHLGPTAQDFKAAFGLGESETGITTVDADGVALAAIQALNAEVGRLKEEGGRQKAENADLKKQLDALLERQRELESSLQAVLKGRGME